jgi:hypothetical protein
MDPSRWIGLIIPRKNKNRGPHDFEELTTNSVFDDQRKKLNLPKWMRRCNNILRSVMVGGVEDVVV